jgi:hypothetical protein
MRFPDHILSHGSKRTPKDTYAAKIAVESKAESLNAIHMYGKWRTTQVRQGSVTAKTFKTSCLTGKGNSGGEDSAEKTI